MTAKKAKQSKTVYQTVLSIPSVQDQIINMSRKFEEVLFKSVKTEDDWFAALVTLSFEAAKVAEAMGFDKKSFLKAFAVTADDVYGRVKDREPAQKPAAAKKKKAPTKRGGKKA